MKLLNGTDIAGFIKERQAKQVRYLIQSKGVKPKLAIVLCSDNLVIATYVRLKQKYGADIGIDVEVYKIDQKDALNTINDLNIDVSVNGIIVQLPLADVTQTDEICNAVLPQKDVDALGKDATLDPATPTAILWLLAGYGIDFQGKEVLVIGRGKLVGAPLHRILIKSDVNVSIADRNTPDLVAETIKADIIITATGSPAILFPDMIKQGAVVVDAGVASEDGKTVGDVHPSVYEREDITITPTKGGVGPLTVCALFENVIRSVN